MNVDLRNPLGKPPVSLLAGLRHVRMPYNVSNGTGSLDYSAAYNLYNPYLNELESAGITPILVVTQSLYGEGRGFNFGNMSAAEWDRYISEFTEALRVVVSQYHHRAFIWEIYNEPDAPQGADYAIHIPPVIYGKMYRAAQAKIRSTSSKAKVMTAGLLSGAGACVQYLSAAGLLQDVEAYAFHPYHQGSKINPDYRYFGNIEDYMAIIRAKVKGELHISEYGLLDLPNEPIAKVIKYAQDYKNGAGNLAGICWYSIRDGMHNGYGALTHDGQLKVNAQGRSLLDVFRGGVVNPLPTDPAGLQTYVYGATSVNARALPNTSSAVIGSITNGLAINQLLEIRTIAPHTWYKVNGSIGGAVRDYWFAGRGASWYVDVR